MCHIHSFSISKTVILKLEALLHSTECIYTNQTRHYELQFKPYTTLSHSCYIVRTQYMFQSCTLTSVCIQIKGNRKHITRSSILLPHKISAVNVLDTVSTPTPSRSYNMPCTDKCLNNCIIVQSAYLISEVLMVHWYSYHHQWLQCK